MKLSKLPIAEQLYKDPEEVVKDPKAREDILAWLQATVERYRALRVKLSKEKKEKP